MSPDRTNGLGSSPARESEDVDLIDSILRQKPAVPACLFFHFVAGTFSRLGRENFGSESFAATPGRKGGEQNAETIQGPY